LRLLTFLPAPSGFAQSEGEPVINESALKDALLALTEIAKNQYELIVSSMSEIAAVREAVRGLDPTFDDTLATKRQQALQNILPITTRSVAILDGLARKLKDGEVC
jgi:hypothetical protein